MKTINNNKKAQNYRQVTPTHYIQHTDGCPFNDNVVMCLGTHNKSQD